MNSGSCPLYDINALDDDHKAICSSKTLNAYKSMNTVELTSKGVNMAAVIDIDVMAALAAAMYVQLAALSFDDVADFNVAVTCDKDCDECFIDGICGYIETNHCGKETTLDFTITSDNFNNICITTTQGIDVNLSEQNDDVPPVCFVPRPNEPTIWVDFGKRRVFYKWEDSLGMNVDEIAVSLCDNKLVLNAIAQDIIHTVLAKIEPSD